MIVLSDKLFLLYFCFQIIQCVIGLYFEDGTCILKCKFQMSAVGSYFCNQECQVEQCITGCGLYLDAITFAPCSTLCTDTINENITEQELGNSVTQVKKQSCIHGCLFGLDGYYKKIVGLSGLDLPGPKVEKDYITHNSVELHWFWNETQYDIPYILQRRVVDTNTEWQEHNFIESLPSGNYNVTHLQPYLTYKFKLIFKITTAHVIETAESAPVTTLPYGVPTSSPTVTNLRAPSPTVVSMSWTPAVYTNGPLISYRLSLHPLGSSDHVTSKDVSPNSSSWIFGHLHGGQKYEVSILAVNTEGEGPAHVMTVTTPTPGNFSEKEMPFLILGAENLVVKQMLLELTREAEKILTKPRNIFIAGVGVHVTNELVLVTDDSGRVTLINVSGDMENGDVYPNLIQPTAVDIDWLNNLAYIADGHRIYQCTIKQTGNKCNIAMDMTPFLPREVKVDPINGYLYYTVMDSKKGLYRVDLEDFKSTEVLINSDVRTFFIDHENLLLYFPDNSQNTIMSAYLDGTGLTDMRQGTVARPHFTNMESVIYYDEKFFWTNGTKVFSEEYDSGNRTYYHNSLLLFENHFRGFNMYYPKAQPTPAPVNPPSRLQVLFTAYKAIIEWQLPDILTFQGNGAYNQWDYEVNIIKDTDLQNQFHQTAKQMQLVVSNLEADTRYQVKVRAKSSSGNGPWSSVFYGRTLKNELDSAKLIVAIPNYKMWEIKEVGMDGALPKLLVETSMLYPGVRDIAWHEDNLFWTTEDGDIFMHQGDTHHTMHIEFVTDAACVTYDWLGHRLYWSVKKHGVIKRANIYESNAEFVYQALAREMTLDSVKGRLYWVTMHGVETTYLNGNDHKEYFSVPYFSGKQVISLSIDPDLQKLIWYVKGYEDQSLYMADLFGYRDNNDDVVNSVELLGNFKDVAMFSPLQYFSHRLFWLDSESWMTVGDTQCNYTSTLTSIGEPVTMFALKHPSLHPYPDNLNNSTITVIPWAIEPETVSCQGVWSNFNVTWEPSEEVNHGHVSYELLVQAAGMSNIVLVIEQPWHTLTGLSPFIPVTVSVRGFTYWGSGPLTTTTVKSPMAAPSRPHVRTVYVTQRKSDASSKLTLAADFRWIEPDQINGILSEQHVYYWKSSQPDMVSSTSLVPSARHFILDGLESNVTYFFQVESCTSAGCGPRSEIANATADAVNPVPKLLLATNDEILLAEADDVKNTSITVATKSVVAMGYLAQDETYYWITRNRYLEQLSGSLSKKLVPLEGEGQSLTLDWISRTLYILESNSTSSKIISYKIDQSTHEVIVQADNKLGHIVVDPYTSTLIWSERDKVDNSWNMISASTDGSSVNQHFSTANRQRRAVNNACNCPASQRVSAAIAMDLSHDGNTEVIFVDEVSYRVLAADIQGCMCRVLLTTTPDDRQGLPADYMTVDHVYIYWYQKSSQKLFTMDKATGKLFNSVIPSVSDILAFGAHLHPLPGSECLDTQPYTDKVDILTFTNTTASISLQAVSWPESCGQISHPAVKYTVFYRKQNDMNPNDDCRPAGQHCMSKAAYSSNITLDGLEPYTYYILHGAVSNYFSDYSATSLGKATMVRTRPGMPSTIVDISAMSNTPNNISVAWPPPYQPNGPLDKIVYYIKWSTKSLDGTSLEQKTNAIDYDYYIPSSGLFMVEIGMLMADQIYTVSVICNQTEGNYYTESLPVWAHTLEEPEDLELVEITNSSIQLSWRSPSDNSTSMVFMHYAEVVDGVPDEFMHNDLPMFTKNYTMYIKTFNNLKPNTQYTFRLNIMYGYSVYQLPKDSNDLKYVFKTLSGIPGQPDAPEVEEFKSGEFEISWSAPPDHGDPITHFILQYRSIDKDNWTVACNTSDLRWVVDDGVLQRGYNYMFRVMAENKKGEGPFSLNSSVFSYPILKAESEDGTVTVIAVVCASVFVAMAVSAICYSCCKRRKEDKKKKKNMEFTAVAPGPDLELATLRELPMTAIQQNNTLYAMSLVPTDDEIAALPHFRRDQLVLCKFLGSGAFGEVFEGNAKNILNESSGDTRCAVKTLRKSASDQEKEEFLKEALLMSNFHHEHILSLLGVCLDNDPQFIILELMEGGDLLSFMRACRLSSIQNRAELSLTDLVKICVHVSRGCKYLEDMHFVHRDLAARNCLVSSCNPNTMVVKIGDFGLARDIYKNDYYRKEGEGLLPVRWMSPESLVDGVFTTQSDIWAFGVLMWEVVTFGQQPYPARTNIEVLHFVRTGGRLDRPDNCPDDFYQLMCKCWSFAPEDRPSFAYLLQQLERFQETCASISEYLVPIRSNNGPIAAVDGYKYLTQRSRRLTSTSSGGPDYQYGATHAGYGSHKSYGKIRRATSFDAPEPKDATQQVLADSSNYLEPRSHHPQPYMEFLPDSRTANYVYDSKGERVRNSNTEILSLPRGPSYVQTTVKENVYSDGDENMTCVKQKYTSKGSDVDLYRKFSHQKSSADSVIMKTVENIPETVTGETKPTNNSSNSACSATNKTPDSGVTYAQVMYGITKKSNHFRKQRLDSSNSILSFDSVQTEPTYNEQYHHRNKLYSSSSSKSNYSMSNISETITEQIQENVTSQPKIDEECQQFWANNTSDCSNITARGQNEGKGPSDYLNLGRRSQVYPENVGVLAGFDIVQASLV